MLGITARHIPVLFPSNWRSTATASCAGSAAYSRAGQVAVAAGKLSVKLACASTVYFSDHRTVCFAKLYLNFE